MKFFFCTLFAFSILLSQAQTNKEIIFYKKAMAFSPLAMADIDHTILLSGEYRLHLKHALTADAGFVFASDYLSGAKHATGFLLRPAYRFYFGKSKTAYWQN